MLEEDLLVGKEVKSGRFFGYHQEEVNMLYERGQWPKQEVLFVNRNIFELERETI